MMGQGARAQSLWVLLLAGLLLIAAGCATASDSRRAAERGPDTVVGEPPSEGSEDYEFAAPPRHPGPHGDVEASSRRSAQPAGVEEGVIARAELRRVLEFGPSVVFEHVDTDPSHEGGRFVGFLIVDVSDEAQRFLSPQVRVGDVITHVNLVRLERPDDYLEAWNALKDAQELRIDFLRDGEAESAVWTIR